MGGGRGGAVERRRRKKWGEEEEETREVGVLFMPGGKGRRRWEGFIGEATAQGT